MNCSNQCSRGARLRDSSRVLVTRVWCSWSWISCHPFHLFIFPRCSSGHVADLHVSPDRKNTRESQATKVNKSRKSHRTNVLFFFRRSVFGYIFNVASCLAMSNRSSGIDLIHFGINWLRFSYFFYLFGLQIIYNLPVNNCATSRSVLVSNFFCCNKCRRFVGKNMVAINCFSTFCLLRFSSIFVFWVNVFGTLLTV